ncbi:MAG TPA: ABC transporter ATP-binding protein [Candidatus Acidoferrum sp.]|nr:ABC transporter ATP-binding protein [Candidatus Acidoferrum sp.]
MTHRSSPDATTIRKVWDLLTAEERRGAMVLLGLTFIGMAMETLGVGLMIPSIALLTQRDFASHYPALQPVIQVLGNPGQRSLVIGGMLVLIVVWVVKAVVLAIIARQQQRFVFGVQVELSQRLFLVYLRQPYTFHLQRNSAQLIRNVINEVVVFAFNALQGGMALVTESMLLLGLAALLLFVEPLGTLIVASVLGTAAWAFHRLTRGRIVRSGQVRHDHDGLRLQHLQQGLGSAKDVKLLGREADFLEQYRVHTVQSARAGQRVATLRQLPRLWLELLAVTGLAVLVIRMAAQGRAPETVLPTLGLFAAAGFRLMPSVGRVISSTQSVRFGLPAVDTLRAELSLAAPEPAGPRPPATPLRTALELSRVTFAYPGAPTAALTDLSLTIRRGESVGVVGDSGAGKSTLVDILLGLLTPDRGEVRVDGEDIRHALRNWQDQLGYVPQSIFLTDDTVARNVAFGLPDDKIDTAAVWRALRAAQLEDFVHDLPQGLGTPVGERGIRLSGGQHQRIGIARALYHDPAVLVLDEATSSLDIATERGVMQAVRALHGRKTVVIVSHRLSTVEQCDRLYRLEQGRMVEEGKPETMLFGRP